jgi:glycosyltransferase involved in cell wall biosynthesis
MEEKKKILLFTDWYEPGFKAGGPIRSCVNFVDHMMEDYLVYIFTSDRDLGATAPYAGIRADQWNNGVSGTQLYYCSPRKLGWQTIREQLTVIQPDFIYLNSMFSASYTLYPLLISRLSRLKSAVVLSPRGMLRASALRFKPFKKRIFLNLFRWSGLYRHVRFHAGDQTEVKDVRRVFGQAARVHMIANFPSAVPQDPPGIEKRPGELFLLFIGRIHPIKNLDYLLEILKDCLPVIRLTIVGSMEDSAYWKKCWEIIRRLPGNITVRYAGEIAHQDLSPVIAGHHVFALPTQGENFGHAIFESLALGRPALISDQTPWRNLASAKAGWDLPLDKPGLFREAIGQAAGFGQEEYDRWCLCTRQYIREFMAAAELKRNYLELFS